MRLLFVTSLVPDGEPTTGYEIANAAMIAALRRNGADVTVLGFTWPGKAPADPQNTVLLGEVDVRTDNAGGAQKLRWLGRALSSGLTFSSVKLRVVSERAIREAVAAAGPFDAYVLNAVTLPGAFESLFNDKPQIFVAHNVEHRSALENAAAAKSLVERLMFRREARLLEALEKRLCDRASFVFTFAEEDVAALGLANSGRAAAVPLVTRPASSTGPVPALATDLALIGTWTWQPNRIGLDWFLSQVRPHLDPGLRVSVAGSTPADLSMRHPGIDFVGRVPDATAFVRSAAVVPLVSRAGTGVQLKTLETFELGLPSVATSRSVRGIAGVPENCTLADDARDFAAALNEKAARARAGDRMLADGAAFHRRQTRSLDEAVGKGLAALGPSLKRKERVAA